MGNDSLRSTLSRLRDELASGEPLGPDKRRLLEEALAQVEQLLSDSEVGDEDPSSLVTALRNTAIHFEESHPKLTMAIGAVADSLSRSGL
jgi:hypothetical protein